MACLLCLIIALCCNFMFQLSVVTAWCYGLVRFQDRNCLVRVGKRSSFGLKYQLCSLQTYLDVDVPSKISNSVMCANADAVVPHQKYPLVSHFGENAALHCILWLGSFLVCNSPTIISTANTTVNQGWTGTKKQPP